MTISVHRVDGGRPAKKLKERLIAAARLLLSEHHLAHGSVAIVLADNQMLQDLNRRFRALDRPTDVLSFPMLETSDLERAGAGDQEETAEILVGDIYISLEQARAQAADAGHSRERELLILTIHGLLHLLGYEHDSAAGAAAMQQKEVEVLSLVEPSAG